MTCVPDWRGSLFLAGSTVLLDLVRIWSSLVSFRNPTVISSATTIQNHYMMPMPQPELPLLPLCPHIITDLIHLWIEIIANIGFKTQWERTIWVEMMTLLFIICPCFISFWDLYDVRRRITSCSACFCLCAANITFRFVSMGMPIVETFS